MAHLSEPRLHALAYALPRVRREPAGLGVARARPLGTLEEALQTGIFHVDQLHESAPQRQAHIRRQGHAGRMHARARTCTRVKLRQGGTESIWSLLRTRVARGVPRTAAKSPRSIVMG